ncbi:sigma-54-dependent Fis family transcriptional regulator [Rhodoplanes serenus]|uniref:sigma-54-dependent Fis family transcriptional regulator n=1 Tax=Rhodoplanes serenus TaxID=200615 RepID=UPI000DAD385D|nr:sigma-54-dependent Fis family transcriptional regulator [Rhodoplanes serenus]RAI35500.1 sigma-54-dependent Fis family transcriptional regulator [Rhodoplanes serenus]
MPSASTQDAVDVARRRFLNEGRVPHGLLAASIVRSWQRCVRHGLDACRRPVVDPPGAAELRHLHGQHERLRRLSRPELEALHGDARRCGSVVILTGPDGTVLDLVGDPSFAGRAARVDLRPGVSWSETATGTNAIGTALVERRPVAVHGREHWFDHHRILACAAAPLVDPRGRLAGVLDLSGPATDRHRHALALVRLVARQIEHRFFADGFAHCTVLRLHRDAALIGTVHEGILVFDDGRLVAADRTGLALVGHDWAALDRLCLDDLTGGTPDPAASSDDGPRRLRGMDGSVLFGRVSPPHRRPVGRGARRDTVAARETPQEADAACAGRHDRADDAVTMATTMASTSASVPHHRRPVDPTAGRVVEPVLGDEMRAALARTARLVDAGIPVLLLGETGSGKEVFARRVHAESGRHGKPFVAVNCAALPEGLIESELFGYEAGAFTGARRDGAKGLLRRADGGILFLDEIGDMPLVMQSRLLRVLQDKEVSPLGGGRPVPVDFALICATHQPLGALLAAGEFRQDLYFRIAQYVVEQPPVRRHPDRRSLVRTLWRRLGGDDAGLVLAPETERLLAAYEWPGNFRQLVGVLRTLMVLSDADGVVTPDLLPADLRTTAAGGAAPSTLAAARPEGEGDGEADPPGGGLADQMRRAMHRALEESGGNVSRAARRLGIDRSTYYRRLRRDGRSRPGSA